MLVNYGWRWSFFVCAIIGTVAGIVWWIIARDDPKDHPSVTRAGMGPDLQRPCLNPPPRLKGHKATPWSAILAKQGCTGNRRQLLHLWLCRLYLLHLVLQIPERRARAGSEIERTLRHAALHGDVDLLHAGRLDSRPAYKETWPAGSGAAASLYSALHLLASSSRWQLRWRAPGLASACAGRRGRSTLLVPESYWAVTADIAGPSAGSVSGLMNMGGQIGGAVTASLDAMDRAGVWMDRFIPHSFCPLRFRLPHLAFGQS